MILNVLDLAREYWKINFPNRDVSTIDVSNVQVEVSGINPEQPISIPISVQPTQSAEKTVESKIVINSNDTYVNEEFNFSVPIDTIMQTTVERGATVDNTDSNLQINGIIEHSLENQNVNAAFITQINMAGQTITNQKVYTWADGTRYAISPNNKITATFTLFTVQFDELVDINITVSGTVLYISNRRETEVPIGVLFQDMQVPSTVYDPNNENSIIYPGKIRFQGRMGLYSLLILRPEKFEVGSPISISIGGIPYIQTKFGPRLYIF